LGSKDTASRPFEASFLEADPDAKRIAAMQFRVVIAGLAAVTRGCCLTLWIGKTKTPVRDVGALETALARHPHSAGLRSLFSAPAIAGEGDHAKHGGGGAGGNVIAMMQG